VARRTPRINRGCRLFAARVWYRGAPRCAWSGLRRAAKQGRRTTWNVHVLTEGVGEERLSHCTCPSAQANRTYPSLEGVTIFSLKRIEWQMGANAYPNQEVRIWRSSSRSLLSLPASSAPAFAYTQEHGRAPVVNEKQIPATVRSTGSSTTQTATSVNGCSAVRTRNWTLGTYVSTHVNPSKLAAGGTLWPPSGPDASRPAATSPGLDEANLALM